MKCSSWVLLTSALVGTSLITVPALSAAGRQDAKGAGDATKGKDVFEQCAMCHNADSAEKKIGPGLKGLFKHDKLTNGKKVTEESVRAIIDEGGNGMPSFADTPKEDKDNLIAYLKTL